MTASIYQILHRESGRCYVGHTTKPARQRFAAHRKLLVGNRHHSPRLQRAWNKYGEAAFSFAVIEICAATEKLIREQQLIDTLDSAFNYARVAGSRLGVPQSPEETERVRKMMLGNKYGLGRKQSDEEKAQRGAAILGIKRSAETRARVSAGNKGKTRGLGHAVSGETRAKISAANKGKPLSAEHRAKIAANSRRLADRVSAVQRLDPAMPMLGRRHSDETKARMRAAQSALREKRIAEGAYEAAGRKISSAKRGANSLRRQFWLIFGEAHP